MQITGRITADAEVRSTRSTKKVVGFTVAVNRSFVSKGERKTETKFFECSYWRTEAIAQYLKKGTLVELSGEVDVRAFISTSNEAVGVLLFRVDNIVLHGRSKEVHSVKPEATPVVSPAEAVHAIDTIPVPEGDLPF